MSAPLIVSVAPASPADRAGLQPGDEIVALNGEVPRDVIAYQLLADEAELVLDVTRGGLELQIDVDKRAGEPLGAEVASALFDQVRTCDNHCEFCFIYQLPPGLRTSLYLKDDDYRLSFLYGNFTTLTRFTEADLERVVTEGISPLHVSIHATDPHLRSEMLRNRRGATSLRWLRALLDHDVAVHGQIVVCPGRNDGAALDDTLAGVLDRFPELASLCIVPLGVSRYNTEPAMRPHTRTEAAAVVAAVHDWQDVYLATLGHRLVFAADEYYLMAQEPFPPAESYEGFPMHEDGVGMVRTFEREFTGSVGTPTGVASGFFAWVDGAPPEGYRAPRETIATSAAATPGATGPPGPSSRSTGAHSTDTQRVGAPSSRAASPGSPVVLRPRRRAPIGILTGTYGATVLGGLVDGLDRDDVRVIGVENRFFGGNTGVAGLMNGPDLTRVLADEPSGHRYLLPDVCLSQGRFLDGTTPAELPRPVEVVATDGIALRAALDQR